MNYTKAKTATQAVVAENDRRRGHRLLPQKLRSQLPALYSTEGQGLEAIAQVKFFTPTSSWTWYLCEFDGEDTCYGLVVGHCIELGYFSLAELEQLRTPMGIPVERDLYFKPTPLRELEKYHRLVEGRQSSCQGL